VPALCRPGSPAHSAYRSSIRYSFCKSVADVDKGAQMLIALGSHLKQHPDALRGCGPAAEALGPSPEETDERGEPRIVRGSPLSSTSRRLQRVSRAVTGASARRILIVSDTRSSPPPRTASKDMPKSLRLTVPVADSPATWLPFGSVATPANSVANATSLVTPRNVSSPTTSNSSASSA